MKTKFFVSMLSTGVAIFLLSGCQKAPQAEIDSAKASVEAAQAAEANKYLAADYQAIQDSLNTALAMIEEQNSKSSLSRKYDEPKRLLAVVSEMANNAVSKTQLRKDELKAQNDALVGEVNAMLEENKALVLKAPKGKEGKAALDLIQQDIVAIEASIAEAASLIASGDILSANDKLTVAKEKAVAINTELNDAIAKAQGIKK